MASERYIDLQLIKPLTNGSGIKGKISLTNLLKEYFNKLNVGYLDPCCPTGSVGAFGCPAISEADGNTITCNADGLFSAGGGDTLAANNGLSVNSGNAVLGQNISQSGNPATLTSNREIPMAGFTVSHRDTTGQSTVVGAGTLGITKLGGTALNVGDTKTSNANAFGIFSTATSTLGGAFLADSTYAIPFIGAKRFNTSSSGVTLTPNASNRLGVVQGTLQFENDVAANNNIITISGAIPISVFNAKVDFWPSAGGQLKTVNGALCMYGTYFDFSSIAAGTSITTLMDFEAGRLAGTTGNPITITNRYGFKVLDLNASTQITTNRWAFYQEGTTDKNYFAGSSGFGAAITTPTAKVHIDAGTATAGTAPLKLTAGTNLTTPEDGTFEYDGTNLYFTTGGTRKTVSLV